MKRPKVYIKSLNMVLPVEVINYHEKTVEVYFNDNADNVPYKFDEVTFIYNTGYKDKSGNYIYTGDIVEYTTKDRGYKARYLITKDKEEEDAFHFTICKRIIGRLQKTDIDLLVIGNIYENKNLLED